MENDFVLYERRDGLAIITLNRPDRLNALSNAVMDPLHDHVRAAADDGAVRAVLLRAAGDGFCSGGDMKSGKETRNADLTVEEQVRNLRRRMDTVRLLHEMPKPTVAALRGAVFGAGVGLALSTDLRIASPTAVFCTAFRNIGFSGDFGGSWFLTKLAGPMHARELFLTARRVKAEEARALGLLNRIVPDEELDQAAEAWAAELAAGPTLAFDHMKRALNAAQSGASLAGVLELEAAAMVRTAQTADHKEAVRAFIDKRPPAFAGR